MKLGTIHKLDCVAGMRKLGTGSVDLAFADPPFNIGYDYDVYDDSKDAHSYLNWSREWIAEVHRVLKPTGTFWLAIGDDYAAELKIESQKRGFHCRSWVIWYYTFGVNCKFKFSRSHTHLFHFVKDPQSFTFNRDAILVPSARQLVYADKRAADGRLPDDTWILRPQDLMDGFNPDEDVWYYPRVAGTFKEREGFHGCQMPEQLLGRIIKACSNPGELVLDPFSGSATSVSVAKKLGRQFISFDISDEYVERGLNRLAGIEIGDPLDGSPDPKVSVAATPSYSQKAKSAVRNLRQVSQPAGTETPANRDFDTHLIEAFRRASDGFSTDRVIADPDLNEAFLSECLKQGLTEVPSFLNRSLFRLRKSGQLTSAAPTTRRTELSWSDADPFLFASEVAWRKLADLTQSGLDDILCNPSMARRFDHEASSFAPGYSSLQYRMAAFKLRKAAKIACERSKSYSQLRLEKGRRFEEISDSLKEVSGLYLVSRNDSTPLYAGETLNLAERLRNQFGRKATSNGWQEYGNDLLLSVLPYSRLKDADLDLGPDALVQSLVAYQFRLAEQKRPILNLLGRESIAV